MVKRTATLTTVLLLLMAVAAPARDEPEARTEEIVERILELQRRIDELMDQLPPEIREQLRERLAHTLPDAAEPPAAEPPAAEPVRTAPPAPPAHPPLPRRRPRRDPCNTLEPLDENADGKVSAADRYWRYLYLWTDKNGDGRVEEREVESAFERGVREIELSLETFMRTKGTLGEARVEDRVVLDVRGDGFSDRARRDDGILMIDATALKRGDGPRLLGPGGDTLEGFQPFRAGLAIQTAGGPATALNCPRTD